MPSNLQGEIKYRPIGTARDLFRDKSSQLVACGPVGTGKTRVIVEKHNALLLKYAGARGLMVRDTRKDLTQTGIKTLENFVMPHGFPSFLHTGNQSYRYPNNSEMVVGGLDDPGNIMSAEYDFIHVLETTQIKQETWEDLITRKRNGIIPYQQIIGDCNPSHPEHWLLKWCESGRAKMLNFTIKDNPIFWDVDNDCYTPRGKQYYEENLGTLTGAKRKRNLLGLWASEEGGVYEDVWEPTKHMTTLKNLEKRFGKLGEYQRFWAVDFGFKAPMCVQQWLYIDDAELEGREDQGLLVLEKQVYHSHMKVKDVCRKFLKPKFIEEPDMVIVDHQAQEIEIFEEEMDLDCTLAEKHVEDGLQKCTERLYWNDDPEKGEVIEPAVLFVENSLVHPVDPFLKKKNKPTCTEGEFLVYVWDKPDKNDVVPEKPKKANDHGMDSFRYMTIQADVIGLSDGMY